MPRAGIPANPQFEGWETDRRREYAGRLVVWEKWSMVRAAREVGISRSRLSEWLSDGNRARLVQEAAQRDQADQTSQPMFMTRRVPQGPEFAEQYFSGVNCPDCWRHHETPGFHREIRETIRNPDLRRILITMPPYHSKTTEIVVYDTIQDIVEDPNSTTILISKSLPVAKTYLVAIKEWLTNEDLYRNAPRNLIQDFGPFEGTPWDTTSITVRQKTSAEKDPTVTVAGVQMQIYGRRGRKIKFDDVATLENQRSLIRVMEMLEWIDKEALSRIGKTGTAIWDGTRVAGGDVYWHLAKRAGYTVISYPCILDEESELTLWPDHFGYEDAALRREEMSDADWNLVYQQLQGPGPNASFPEDILDLGKDRTRVAGHYESNWHLVAGLDLAGGTKDSGYCAFVLQGIDPETRRRYLIDAVNHKSMRPPQIKAQMLEWSDMYPIREWRVENNGLQSQLVQYNDEIIVPLAHKGVRVNGHQTSGNKWDQQFGVESCSPLWAASLVSVPWSDSYSRQLFQPLFDQLLMFPLGKPDDLAMAYWMADLGCRDAAQRNVLPLFTGRRVPARVAARRRIISVEDRTVRPVDPEEQRRAILGQRLNGRYRRRLIGVGPSAVPLDYEGPDPETL